MKNFFALFVAILLTGLSASAQDWAKARLEKSPRHLEWVKVKNGAREVNCFVAYPEVKEKAPAVLLIHEIFGLTDWVRSLADQLAEAGYVAIAPDLLSGTAPGGGGTAELGGGDAVRKAISSLPPEQITADLNAVADYVAKLPACSGKVTVAGFCWGGGQSFRFATNRRDLTAALVFYGTGPNAEKDLARIQCSVYGFYGGNDARVTATVPQTQELMKKAGKTYQPAIYDGAGHGFMRAGEAPDAKEPDKRARDAAWKRCMEILKAQ
ncbi:MAG TPA: dienelactone hydrolase family protein [Candidatus Binatia bacterium]|nr:dienelactone hydrolase family protein [Candidatus Binatia bacterium]